MLEALPLYPELLRDALKLGLHEMSSASMLTVKQRNIRAGWLTLGLLQINDRFLKTLLT